jgi:leucyl aminopeptidase
MTKTQVDSLHRTIPSFLSSIPGKALRQGKTTGFVFILAEAERAKIKGLLQKHSPDWQKPGLLKQIQREVIHFAGVQGPVWIFCQSKPGLLPGNLSGESEFSWHRDQAGGILGYARAYRLEALQMELGQLSESAMMGALVGMEVSGYSFKGESEFPLLSIRNAKGALSSSLIERGRSLGASINLARHLVNCPPNVLNPRSFADFLKANFSQQKNMSLEVWDTKRLQKENMGLLLGVGQGSENPACLVHIRYRKKGKKNQAPIAFVGKGICFDTGGLDIKPSSGMRLMKKDMGGAAALVGLAHWLVSEQPAVSVDIYLALAENSVDSKSMRPSDVLTSRSGHKVEIHNTDAEGRLVMADALDVAITQKDEDEPVQVIDVATLTGAIKVALGGEVAGLFSNDDRLAHELTQAGLQMGEPNWRMPLYQKYGRGMDTPFADFTNCVDGFGGAITAALFLEKFVKNKAWAHLDIYAWNDKPSGALNFSGGNGQAVQTLIQFLLNKQDST